MEGNQVVVYSNNKPGASIMPGKVNPKQVEAVTMVCFQILGNDTTIYTAGSGGHFEFNVFKPDMIGEILGSTTLMVIVGQVFK
ncbi:lyase family protein [Carboxylicivirga caseinilyticus]|uniref:lyase family protein n=1 Tax=Carboxylicivirga caseinilyticus TaxID=3417572 RepID=UPI003D33BCAC